MQLKPSAILIHVPDVQAGLAWYQQAFHKQRQNTCLNLISPYCMSETHDRSGASG
ncbi:hypothetical protein [Providencia hangzhouensis]|uniref:hypothetical protein n=1 Tax=Providencia hangzhouensis TaxID=3031799 RepID=UPI0034DDBE75